MSDMDNRELEWDDELTKDGDDFEILPEGDYNFEVVKLERARYMGGEKIPACKKAMLTLDVESPQAEGRVIHSFFLHTKTMGLISAFFVSIGQKKKGEPIRMNWDKVVGLKGRCKIGSREWTNDRGEKKTSTDIKKFYEPEESAPSSTPGFTPGKF